MEIIRRFIDGATVEPLADLLRALALGSGDRVYAFAAISVLFFVNEFLKTYLMVEHTRSRLVHVGINVMTVLPALFLAVIVVYAGYMNPARMGGNFLFCLACFVPWHLSGKITRLGRRDTEGADIGFMFVGVLILAAAGIVAALLF